MSSSDDEDSVIVIDSGSGTCMAGFAGDDAPRLLFSSVVGTPRHNKTTSVGGLTDTYVGDEAQAKRDFLSLHYPVKQGIIDNWDHMELIWSQVFKELAVSSRDRCVLLSEPLFNPKCNREKTLEVMFETFSVPAAYLQNQSILSLYSSGRGSGLLTDIGDGVGHVLPIYEGYAIAAGARQFDIAGRDITSYLAELLRERDLHFATSSEMETVREMKESVAYAALDFDAEMAKASSSSSSSSSVEQGFTLPDGQVITVGSERFRCTEALFQPSLLGLRTLGLHEVIFESLMACEYDVRKDLHMSFILSGGCTMFPGFPERLRRELQLLSSSTAKLRVVDSPERRFFVWIGGSILGSLSTSQRMQITRREYNECGPSIVHGK